MKCVITGLLKFLQTVYHRMLHEALIIAPRCPDIRMTSSRTIDQVTNCYSIQLIDVVLS